MSGPCRHCVQVGRASRTTGNLRAGEGELGVVIPRSINTVYTRDLGSALRQRKVYDPDYALAQDPEFYEKLRKYPVVDGAVNLRKLMVAGSDWYLEPASAAIADRAAVPIFEALLKQLKAFEVARYNLAEALIKGSTWSAIQGEWRMLEIPPLPPMRWWVITGLVDMDKRRFALVREGDSDEFAWHVESSRPPYTTEPIVREHFVRVAYGSDEASLGYGRGLAESILYPFWYATSLDEHAAQFGERWAQGFRIWKLGAQGAPLTSQKRQEYLDLIDKLCTRYGFVGDKEDEFELVDAPAQAFQFISQRQEYYNAIIRVRIMGSSLMTDPQVKGGSFALGDAQYQNTTQLMVNHDRGVLDEALTNDLMGALWRNNYQNFLAVGLRTTAPSTYHTRDLKQHDPVVRFPVLEAAQRLGIPIRIDEAYEQLSLTPPTPGEPTLKAPASGSPTPGSSGTNPMSVVPSKRSEMLGFEAEQRSRSEMPQIPSERIPAFVEWLRNVKNIAVEPTRVSASELASSQKELNRAKVERLKAKGLDELLSMPPLLTAHGEGKEIAILDGHHRAAAIAELDPDAQVRCLDVACTIEDAIATAHEFPGVEVRGIRDGAVKAEVVAPSVHMHMPESFAFEAPKPEITTTIDTAPIAAQLEPMVEAVKGAGQKLDALVDAVQKNKPVVNVEPAVVPAPVVNVAPALPNVTVQQPQEALIRAIVSQCVAEAVAAAMESREKPRNIVIKRDREGRIVGAESRPLEE